MGIGRIVVKNLKKRDGGYSYSVSLRFGKHVRVPGLQSDDLEHIGCWLIQTARDCHDGMIKHRLQRD